MQLKTHTVRYQHDPETVVPRSWSLLIDDLRIWGRIFLSLLMLVYSTPKQASAAPKQALNGAGRVHESVSAKPRSIPSPDKSSSNHKPEEMMEMPLVAPLFIEDGQTSSLLNMVNELATSADASLELFAPDGSLLTKQMLHFGPHTQKVVKIADVLSKANSGNTTGWVRIIPDPMTVSSMAIAAQLSLTFHAFNSPSFIEEEFLMQNAMGALNILRTSSPASTTPPLVAVVNASEHDRMATVTCIGGAQHGSEKVRLSAHAQRLLAPCNPTFNLDDITDASEWVNRSRQKDTMLDSRAHGIEIIGSGAPGDILAFGVTPLLEPENRDLLAVNFTDAGTLKSHDMVFTGVPVGSVDLLSHTKFTPVISLANFSNTEAHVSIRQAYMEGDTPADKVISTLAMAPRTSALATLPIDKGTDDLRNSFVVSSDVAPGTLSTAAYSKGQLPFKTVQLIGKDRQQGESGGGHPWTIANGQKADLLLFNHSDKPRVFTVNIAAEGSKNWQQLYTLASNETRDVSINRVIESQEKDRDKNVIPKSARAGEVSWFTPFSGQGTGRLLISSTATGLARNFSCGYNIVLCGASLYTNAINLPMGFDSTPLSLGSLYGQQCLAFDPNACSGQSYGSGGGGTSYRWQPSNPAITTIAGSTTSDSAALHGVSLGQGGATGFISNGHCNPSAGGSGTVSGTSWIALFGVETDGASNVVLTPDQYNSYVNQGLLPAGVGVALTIGDAIPGLGEVLIVVSVVYFAYQLAKTLSQNKAQYVPIEDYPCGPELIRCIEQKASSDCGACYRECKNNGYVWPQYKCPIR